MGPLVWNPQSGLPVRASRAKKLLSSETLNPRQLAVASPPAHGAERHPELPVHLAGGRLERAEWPGVLPCGMSPSPPSVHRPPQHRAGTTLATSAHVPARNGGRFPQSRFGTSCQIAACTIASRIRLLNGTEFRMP